jgi:MoaA/NifB/PqqE/SkfB family radical SAM enzyme
LTIPYIYWHVTYDCNFQCPHCFVCKDVFPDVVLQAVRATILERIVGSNLLKVDFSGGEPLLVRRLFEYMSIIRGAGIGTTLTSNGWLVQDFIDEIQELADWIILSMDGVDEKTHDRLRARSGAFKRVVAAAKQLSSRGKLVRINTVVSRQNYHEVRDLALFARDLGATQITFMHFIPLGLGLLNRGAYEMSVPRFRSIVEPIKEEMETTDFKVNVSDRSRYVGFPAVEPNGLVTTIDANGRRIVLGSLESSSLQQIWSSMEISHQIEFSRLR